MLPHTYTCVIFCVKRRCIMATNLAIDDSLILEAQRVGHHKTKKDAVNTALQEYIKHKKQVELFDMFGAVDFDEDYDYKKNRQR